MTPSSFDAFCFFRAPFYDIECMDYHINKYTFALFVLLFFLCSFHDTVCWFPSSCLYFVLCIFCRMLSFLLCAFL